MHSPLFCFWTLVFSSAVVVQTQGQIVDFNRDVRPILSDRCYACHGPDAAAREAELRLDVEAAATADRGGYAVVVPHDTQNSELIRRILTDDPDEQMPPADSGRTLSSTEKQTLSRWIEQGATWQKHWAFVPPVRPALPPVTNRQWPRNGIDHFVMRHLEAQGLKPAPEASRETWIRRVTLDLTGLPPTIADVDAFLTDQSRNAYENVVDRLLMSPRYGEHMAVMWLDAARYADTDGYQNDGPRTMWRWRDWVINAYNENMPFDQFTVEQLAGDLLANASLQNRIATGFNRNHRYNSEAGLVLEEFLLENAVDRVDTAATVWMGLTIGCARCHDHKYDPVSQREYYQLVSFFDNVSESGRAVKFGNSEPWVIAPTDRQQEELDALDEDILKLQRQRHQKSVDIAMALTRFERTLAESDTAMESIRTKPSVSAGLENIFHFEDQETEGISVESGTGSLREGFDGKSATVNGNGILALGKRGDVACQTRSAVAFWINLNDLRDCVILSRQGMQTTRPGLAIELQKGKLAFYIITRWVAGVGAVETVDPLPQNQWVHVTLTNDGSQSARGMQIWLNGQLAKTKILYNTNSNTGGTPESAVLRIGGGVHGEHFDGQLDELRFYSRTLFPDEIELLAEPSFPREIVKTPRTERTPGMQGKLVAWFLEHVNSSHSETARRLAELRQRRIRLVDSFPTSMVMEERDTPGLTHIRIRGAYNQYGDPVESDVPASLPPVGKPSPNRLDFARWLVSRTHPLTARVAVNRYWQKYFGTGLVKTSEDFGLQGELPSHPDLLDWLAVKFMDGGWDVKALQKLIVLSATYRQSSAVASNDDSRENSYVSDPANRLLSRGPDGRLPARTLRDQALFVSGLLTPDIGGPSVSPYQPERLWREMSNMTYRQSKGRDLYRRGLYTIWKRTIAPPSLAILDAADRESCNVRPKRTNTPLQALTLLNETTFVEAARHLAARMITEGGDRPVEWAFRTVTARRPTELERQSLHDAREEYLSFFKDSPDDVQSLLSVGESVTPADLDQTLLAANTLLCNVLLNLDEVITSR